MARSRGYAFNMRTDINQLSSKEIVLIFTLPNNVQQCLFLYTLAKSAC